MDGWIRWLLHIYSNDTGLLRVAVKIDPDMLSAEAREYYNEKTSREEIHKLLPEHVASIGPIIFIEEIFDIGTIE